MSNLSIPLRIGKGRLDRTDNTRKSKAACYYDKIICACLTAESYAYFKGGDKEKAAETLKVNLSTLYRKLSDD